MNRRRNDQKMMQLVGLIGGLVCLLMGYAILENRHGNGEATDPRDNQNYMRNERPIDNREDFTLMTADQNVITKEKPHNVLHSLNVSYAGADALPEDIVLTTDTGSPIPEPTTLGFVGAGAIVMLYRRKKQLARAS